MNPNSVRDGIISETGIIPLEGVVVKSGDRLVEHRGLAGMEVRGDTSLKEVLPGNVILTIRLYDEDHNPFVIAATVEAKHLIEQANRAASA